MSHIDMVWVLLCTALVMVMQAGFCCLETGLVRSKNSINVAIKNVADFCLSGVVFWLVGFGLMFGVSETGLWGTSRFVLGRVADPAGQTFFLFQLVFCSTAATIISGAVAERLRFWAYLLIAMVVSAVIYPVFGHWAWGGADGVGTTGWLAELGFIDFAGSTVVHSVGGWTALAAVLVLGPRLGRFRPEGNALAGHDLPMAALGTFLLFFGWFGFNGGSTLAVTDAIPSILVNTVLAGLAGGVGTLALSWVVFRQAHAGDLLNGVLAGLVGITAGCHLVSPASAVAIGAIAAGLALGASRALARWRVDDVIGAVPVHAVAGAWGTLAVALFGDPAAWGPEVGRLGQLLIQATGVAACLVWSFGVGFGVLWAVNRWVPLRVSVEDERLGLNVAEHGARTASAELLDAMETQRRNGDFSRPVAAEPHTEVGLIASQYNRVVDRLNAETAGLTAAHEEISLANLELIRSRDDAMAGGRAKSVFLATMSHEIRTPMSGTLGMIELLLDTPLSREQRDYAETAWRSCDSLLTLLNDILDLSRIESGKLSIEVEDFDPRAVVDDVVSLFAGRVRRQRLELGAKIDAAVPCTLRGDQRRMRQVVLNVVGNAVKFTEQGHVTVYVTWEQGTAGAGTLRVAVEDTGPGVSPAARPHLFQAFSQVDGGTTRKHGGSGLGLAISKQLVELMEGAIGVDSVQGQGSTFWFTVPLQAPCGEPSPQHRAALPSHVLSADGVGERSAPTCRRVLVAEDNPVNRKVTTILLERLGCDVAVVSDGRAAIDAVSRARFDVVFMDCQMPELDGFDAAAEIRRRETRLARTPIIALTANAMAGDRERCLQAGMDDYLSKPVKPADLAAMLGRWCAAPVAS